MELQAQLDAASKNLAEVSADRDMFLRRLQQLELESGSEGGSSGGSSALELQRQKAHAAQVGVHVCVVDRLMACMYVIDAPASKTTDSTIWPFNAAACLTCIFYLHCCWCTRFLYCRCCTALVLPCDNITSLSVPISCA